MRPKLYFAGTVSKQPKQIPNSKNPSKPLVAFMLESQDPGDKYPYRVKVMAYEEKATGIAIGDNVFVDGDAKATGYLGKENNESKGALEVFANSVSIFNAGNRPVSQESLAGFQDAVASIARQKKEIPPKGSPAAGDDDSVPF